MSNWKEAMEQIKDTLAIVLPCAFRGGRGEGSLGVYLECCHGWTSTCAVFCATDIEPSLV